MGKGLNKAFFKNGSSDQRHVLSKIKGKRYFLNLLLSAMTMSLILVGIFCRPIFDSVVSVLVLGVFAVMSALDYKK